MDTLFVNDSVCVLTQGFYDEMFCQILKYWSEVRYSGKGSHFWRVEINDFSLRHLSNPYQTKQN